MSNNKDFERTVRSEIQAFKHKHGKSSWTDRELLEDINRMLEELIEKLDNKLEEE